ncbi:hypothetical protein AUR04nite_32090 [Glutamicibacter uratoxydans]|uniref:Endonuclease/exonuclease/phosphatase domain-containing protein n=1 Tax=Glutamicibacter uratoxydans TaxID=43667 RepID=A0A4Y4DSR6_GLUUR|nr:endonuclease/exonuclease/phosphatase family protein [Glutamicibacter uratoxydans]GED07677.1 hypothetical protein AUR04nite_32090 [Glutamicibacter uratoxydans]
MNEQVEMNAAGGLRKRWLALGAGLVSLGCLLLPHLNLLVFGKLPLFQALLPVICLGLLLLGIALLLFRRRAVSLILIAGALLTALPLLIPFGHISKEQPAAQLTVFSLNVQHSGASVKQINETIINNDVGLVVLAEVDENFIAKVLDGVAGQVLTHRTGKVSAATAADAAGTVILSRYPLAVQDPISGFGADSYFDQPTALVDHPELGILRIAGIHTQPPVVYSAVPWRQSLEQLDDWSRSKNDLPLIIAGDFNASQGHPVYRKLAANFDDTAVAAGIFPRPTWPSKLPFTAIDHILVSGLCPLSWATVDISGTDHLGVLASMGKGRCSK